MPKPHLIYQYCCCCIHTVSFIFQFVTSASKTVSARFQGYITNTWNIVDLLAIFMFVLGIILRFLPYTDTLEAARVVFSLNLVVFFLRILHIFSVFKELGPKLVMIGKMVSLGDLYSENWRPTHRDWDFTFIIIMSVE